MPRDRDEPDPQGTPTGRTKIIAAFAVIYLVWGSTFLAIRIGVQELPPLLFAAGRFAIAGGLLAAVAFAVGERFPRTRREWLHAGLFSILMIPLSNGLSTVAIRHVPSNEAALLAAGSAFWLAGLGAIGPRGHTLTSRSILGLLLGLAGVALLVWPQGGAAPGHLGWRALLLGSSLNFAIASIVYRDAQLAVGADRLQCRGDGAGRRVSRDRRRGRGRACAMALERSRHRLDAVPRAIRLRARVHRLHLAAQARAGRPGRNVCLRQPRDRDGPRLGGARRSL